MKLTSLSIVIPCYNTESTVKNVIIQAYTVGKTVSKSVEIIALDDASSDATLSIVRSLKKKIPSLKLLTHRSNMGYGETIKTLYKSATRAWIFSLPSDDQFDANEIHKLLPFSKTSDMVLGRRVIRNDRSERKFQSYMYNVLLSKLFGLKLHDANTIRLMKKTVIDRISLLSHSAFVDAELAIRMTRAGMTIIEVPIIHKTREDHGGSGGKFFKTIVPTIRDMVAFYFSL